MVIEDIPASMPLGDLGNEFIQPLIDTVQPILVKISLLVGGLFGIYFLLLLSRVYYERKKVKLLQDICYDLDQLNIHYGVKYSRQKKGIFQRMFSSIKKMFKKGERYY